jgi:NAD(P)-dependent dehydrogenase (short-subunit alcohol dehydrogenase family)
MRSYVVTGGGRGIGRALAERLAADGHVVVVDLDADALGWTDQHAGVTAVAGDASDEELAAEAAGAAEAVGPLAGWVNNAAVFRDASVHNVPASDVLQLIMLNLALAVTGCATAVRHFLASGRSGAIVNVSSHQAQRPVPGALPYATAKAAVEGLTRALAVEYGPHGIRTNAVAPGTIATERYETLLQERRDVERQIGSLHPLGPRRSTGGGRRNRCLSVVTRGELRQRRNPAGGRWAGHPRPGSRGVPSGELAGTVTAAKPPPKVRATSLDSEIRKEQRFSCPCGPRSPRRPRGRGIRLKRSDRERVPRDRRRAVRGRHS